MLTLGHVLAAAGVDVDDVLVVRHTYTPSGITGPGDATVDRLTQYTRSQDLHGGKIPAVPPRWWLVFIAEAGLRSRLAVVFDNHGENTAERTQALRFFDLVPVPLLASLENRLVIEWSKDAVNWAKRGALAARFPVVEIAAPAIVEFPGYDDVLLTYAQLQQVVTDPAYARWQAALRAVRGIYLITDTHTGQAYVGKADSPTDGIWGRWVAYATTGHGGNVAMRDLVALDPGQPHRYRFCILRIFPTNTTTPVIDAAEAHYKDALVTRTHGLNRN